MADLSNIRIVIVEADAELRTLMTKILREAGVNRMELFDGVIAATGYLREVPVDLIIYELEHTPIDGSAFAHALRGGKVKMNAKTPLLLTAATNDLVRLKSAVAAGANNIVLKPFSADDLLKRVKKSIGRA